VETLLIITFLYLNSNPSEDMYAGYGYDQHFENTVLSHQFVQVIENTSNFKAFIPSDAFRRTFLVLLHNLR
jgi:hypothetical protein